MRGRAQHGAARRDGREGRRAAQPLALRARRRAAHRARGVGREQDPLREALPSEGDMEEVRRRRHAESVREEGAPADPRGEGGHGGDRLREPHAGEDVQGARPPGGYRAADRRPQAGQLPLPRRVHAGELRLRGMVRLEAHRGRAGDASAALEHLGLLPERGSRVLRVLRLLRGHWRGAAPRLHRRPHLPVPQLKALPEGEPRLARHEHARRGGIHPRSNEHDMGRAPREDGAPRAVPAQDDR